MYHLYRKTSALDGARYVHAQGDHIFGCRMGRIPKLLRQLIPKGQNEPYRWHLPLSDILRGEGLAFLIDLKPKNKSRSDDLSLYELLDVWGYSAYGWTPAMMRLRGLCVDGEPHISDPKDFQVEFDPHHAAVYSLLYFKGTVQGGEITGPWTSPRSSPTNSVLLWPDALRYFVAEIRAVTPEIFDEGAA